MKPHLMEVSFLILIAGLATLDPWSVRAHTHPSFDDYGRLTRGFAATSPELGDRVMRNSMIMRAAGYQTSAVA
jgi:hypothetical protein